MAYFYTNTESKLYLREIASILREDAGNLSKELSHLEEEGIFIAEMRGNQKYFSLNLNYPLYKELKSIIFKTIGIEGSLKTTLRKINGIRIAFIYGSFASDKQNGLSDIDLAIIGKINENGLLKEINKLEKILDREINYTLYSETDWDRMKKMKDTFTANIFDEPKIMLIGGENEL
ncbi:MAG: nucleotidyltransferase domain-containing protein [Patescibacteria group bacterium]